MKRLLSILKPILFILSIGLSYGFFGFLDRVKGPGLPKGSLHQTEKEARWARFLGYDPEAYTSMLSTFTQDGILIITQQSKKILGLKHSNGEICWSNSTRHVLTNAAVTNVNKVFIATDEPRLLALDAYTGDIKWSTELPHRVFASVGADESQVFVKTIAGDLIALNAKNGKTLWQYKHKSSPIALTTSSAPRLTKDKVLVGFPDGKLIAFDRNKGKVVWEHMFAASESGKELDTLSDIASDPIVDENNAVVYGNAYHNELRCLSLETGRTIWAQAFSGYFPLLLGENLYALDDKQVLYAFNPQTGEIIWKQLCFKAYKEVDERYNIIGPTLTEKGKQIVIADSQGGLYWISSSNGRLTAKASFKIASPILTAPLTRANMVYTINRRSQVAAWDSPPKKSATTLNTGGSRISLA